MIASPCATVLSRPCIFTPSSWCRRSVSAPSTTMTRGSACGRHGSTTRRMEFQFGCLQPRQRHEAVWPIYYGARSIPSRPTKSQLRHGAADIPGVQCEYIYLSKQGRISFAHVSPIYYCSFFRSSLCMHMRRCSCRAIGAINHDLDLLLVAIIVCSIAC